MAVKCHDGFDHYAAQGDFQTRVSYLQWTDITYDAFVSFGAGRVSPGRCLQITSSNLFDGWVGCSLGSTLGTGFVGMALLSGQSSAVILSFTDTTVVPPVIQFTVTINMISGQVVLSTGATSALSAVSPYAWQFIEVGATIGNGTGSIDVHVEGVSVVSQTGVVNMVSENAYFSGFRINPIISAPGDVIGVSVDDLYVCDSTTGPGTFPCNSFLGDTRTDPLFPISNNTVTWTPYTGQNWQMVSSTVFDGDATYNYVLTDSGFPTDLYNFGTLSPDVSVVFAVTMTAAYRKLDATAAAVQQNVHIGGTSYPQTKHAISTVYAYYCDLMAVDPSTSASWAVATVNSMSAGPTATTP